MADILRVSLGEGFCGRSGEGGRRKGGEALAELGDTPEVEFSGEIGGVGIFGGGEEGGGIIPAGLVGGVDGFSEEVEAFEGIWGEGIFGAKEFVDFFWG